MFGREVGLTRVTVSIRTRELELFGRTVVSLTSIIELHPHVKVTSLDVTLRPLELTCESDVVSVKDKDISSRNDALLESAYKEKPVDGTTTELKRVTGYDLRMLSAY